jgi:hypothetical protein
MDKRALRAVPEPPAGLAERILSRIEYERRRRLAIRAWAFGAALAGSMLLIIYGSLEAATEASRSGFLVFFSLLFSDFSATVASFSDYLLSIAESFPVFATVILLSGVLVATWSAAKFAKEIALLRRGPPAKQLSA